MTRKKGQVPGLETLLYLILLIAFFVFIFFIVKKLAGGATP